MGGFNAQSDRLLEDGNQPPVIPANLFFAGTLEYLDGKQAFSDTLALWQSWPNATMVDFFNLARDDDGSDFSNGFYDAWATQNARDAILNAFGLGTGGNVKYP